MPSESAQSIGDAKKRASLLSGVAAFPFTRPKWLWLLVLSSGLSLLALSHFNYLLFHTLVETSSIALAVAVFLIGWNTRYLTHSPIFMILGAGLLGSAFIDLLHMLAYKGMNVFPGISTDLPTQFWVAARYVNAVTFLLASASLRRSMRVNGWPWLVVFLGVTSLLVVSIWPLQIFPESMDDHGLTPFKVFSEYMVSVIMACSAALIWVGRKKLSEHLVRLLLMAILVSILSELFFTFYHDVFGLSNILGHLFKVFASVFVYMALVEGTLRDPFNTLFRELSDSNQRLIRELEKRQVIEEEKRITNQEFSLLYRLARLFHSTLQLDALTHLILSAATTESGGGFSRAMLFTINERTGTIQGMLGIDRQSASLLLPEDDQSKAWYSPNLDREMIEVQRDTEFHRLVVKQRLPLDSSDNPLSKAFVSRQAVLMFEKQCQSEATQKLFKALRLGTSACIPLLGRNHPLGLLVVETIDASDSISMERLRFLELFARQAGAAMENAQLVQRLQGAHDELRDVQERLIEGEKLAVLGEMAAQLAHELKNPLVSIGGFAQRLKRLTFSDPKASEYTEIIVREVRRLEDMLANILAFSKKQLACLEECDVIAMVREVMVLEREHCLRQSVDVAVSISEELPIVTGDCQQLRQVLLNLMINARQSMPKGGTLTVRVYTGLLRGDEAVVMEVEDTGGGITPAVMRNIFNPFFSTQPKGTGLGLSISHRIVEHHHGEIEVANSECGAKFIVRIPVRQPFFVRH